MRYKNTKTGAIIDVKSVIVGGNWKEVKESKPKKGAKDSKKETEDSKAKKEA